MVINLISCPRTISTALMYSFAQRSDMLVFDEPFYGVYLFKTNFDHPGKDEIIRSMPTDEDNVLEQIITRHNDGKHLFIKNMASHFLVLDASKFATFRNVFLIRDPQRIITSYSKVIEQPTAQDVGIQRQAKLFRQYIQQVDSIPIVIDSNDILDNPEKHLTTLCTALDLPFDRSMLKWPSGPKEYDGIWAPYWYKHVHHSTCFERQPSSQDPIPEKFLPLYDESLEDYHFLYQYSLTNPGYVTEV